VLVASPSLPLVSSLSLSLSLSRWQVSDRERPSLLLERAS
jgi:hypothetical protein